MTVHTLPPETRARMNAAYRALRDRTGLGAWLVKAYVAARAWRQDPAEALAIAHFGVGLARLGPGGRASTVQWLAKLDGVAGR